MIDSWDRLVIGGMRVDVLAGRRYYSEVRLQPR